MTKHVGFNEYRQRLERAGIKFTGSDAHYHDFEIPGQAMPVRLTIDFDPDADTFRSAEMTMETRDQEHQVARYQSMAALDRALGIAS